MQLLVHGATYNHLYWDFPHGPGYYSYVDAATAAGYATFVTVPELGDATSILSEPSAQQLACRLAAVPARRSHQAGGL